MQVTTTQQLDIVFCGLDHDHDPHRWQDEVEGIPADWYWCDGSAFAADFADLPGDETCENDFQVHVGY